MSYFDYIISGTKDGKTIQRVYKNVFVTNRWVSGGIQRAKQGEMKASISKEFLEFMKDEEPGKLDSCQCYNNAPSTIRKYTQKTLKCDVFERPVRYLPRVFNAQCYETDNGTNKPYYYSAIVNNCQLRPTNIIPDGGNCGLCAFSLVLRSNYDLFNKLDDLRKNINLQPLFEYPSLADYAKKNILK